jgi:NAD(P)-dependent dehydrogenase (short-subunit alcohol dehydrogenase family)
MPMNQQAHTATARLSVVTGATGMLGRATAIDLAAGGADVLLVCRDPTRGAGVLDAVGTAGPGGSHRVLAGDLADPEAVHALAAQIHDHTNQLHALVHTGRRPHPRPSGDPGRPRADVRHQPARAGSC